MIAGALVACGDNHEAVIDAEVCHGRALHFAGAQFLDVEDAPELEAYPPRTVELWIQLDAPPTSIVDVLAHYSVGPLNQADGWRLKIEPDASVTYVWYETTLHIQAVNGGALDTTWTHLAAVSPAGGFGHLYLNGHAVGQTPFRGAQAYTGPVRIGASNLGDLGFTGTLEELRISKTARYTADFDVPRAPFVADADTIGLWHFDEGQGLVAADDTNVHPAMMPSTPSMQPTWVDVPCIDQLRP